MRNEKTILVVDDDLHIRRATELKMAAAGYRVLTACDGREGVGIIQAEHPHAVITDINMPEIDGRELCETTDALKSERPFLTVVLTARIMPNDESWIGRLRQTVFMEKPFSPRRLLELVDQYLGETDEG